MLRKNEKKKTTKNKTRTAAASAARLRLESADARTDSGLAIEMRDVVVLYGRGRPPMDSRGLRRKEAPADAAAAEADERAAVVDEEDAVAPLIVVVLGMEARMVAKSREMLRWRMHGFGTWRGL